MTIPGKFLRMVVVVLLLAASATGWIWFPSIPFSSSLGRYLPGASGSSSSHLLVSMNHTRKNRSIEAVAPIFTKIQSLPYVTASMDPRIFSNKMNISFASFVNDYSSLKQYLPFLSSIPFVERGGSTLNGLYRLSTEGLNSTDILNDLESIQSELLPEGWSFHIGGEPVINGWLTRASVGTQRILFPLLVGVGVLVMGLLYRSVRVLVLLSGVVFVTVGFPFLIMSLMGYPHDLLSILAPLLVFIIALASSAHFLSEYFRAEGNTREKVKSALRSKWKPVLLCHVTTAVGFGSLVISEIPAIRALGMTVFFGIGLMSLFYFVSLPPLIKWLRPRNRQWIGERINPSESFYNNRWLRITIFLVVVGLILAGGLSYQNLDYETRALTYFSEEHPVRQDFKAMTASFVPPRGGTIKLEFESPQSFPNPNAIQNWSKDIKKIKGVNHMLIPDRTVRNGSETVKEVALLEPVFFVTLEGLDQLKMIRSKIVEKTDRHFPDLREMKFDGILNRIYHAQKNLRQTLYRSFLLAAIVIFGILFLFLRKISVFLSVIIVNLFPIGTVLTVMYVGNYRLSAGTIVIFSMILGLAVNDTIHLTSHVREQKPDILRAIRKNIQPVLNSSLILAAGLSVFVIVDFIPVKQFGMFTTAGIGFALFGDCFALPVFYQIFCPGGLSNGNSRSND